eukprot:9847262-Alexandrium_andersonii.AAC.1
MDSRSVNSVNPSVCPEPETCGWSVPQRAGGTKGACCGGCRGGGQTASAKCRGHARRLGFEAPEKGYFRG